MTYNYKNFEPQSKQKTDGNDGITVGQCFPFNQIVIDESGEELSLDFLRSKAFVLETGSLTCPHYIEHVAYMNSLASLFRDTTFIVLYVREQHPGEGVQEHQHTEAKKYHAKRLRSLQGENRRIVVDQVNGRLHKMLGSAPNSVVMVNKQGTVEFFRTWNVPKDLELHLSGLVVEKKMEKDQRFEPQAPSLSTTLPILAKAGPSALWNYIRSRPFVWGQRKKNSPPDTGAPDLP